MSGTDWRALCEELLRALTTTNPSAFGQFAELEDRARTALAQPEPEVVGPTPSNQLVEQWIAEVWHEGTPVRVAESDLHIAARAAEWGARWGRAGLADGPAVPEGREPAAVVREPSDEELLDLAQHHSVSYTMSDGTVVYPLQHGSDMRDDVLSFARAVLARYGHQPAPAAETDAILALAAIIREVDGNHSLGAAALAEAILSHRDSRWGQQPAPPAAGEVGELVAWLRDRAESTSLAHNALRITRAADLLERQAAPVLEPALARINDILNDSGRILQTDELEALELARQALEQRHPAPVPVSERLPAMVTDGLRVAGDCDEQGRCWAGTRASVDTSGDRDIDLPPSWELREVCAQDDVWLPAHALPLPAGEVE